MTIAIGTLGTIAAVVSGSVTPAAGGAYNAGDLLIYSTGEYQGSDVLSFPDSSWTLWSLNSAVKSQQVYVKVAGSSSETIPTVTWSASNPSWAQLSTLTGAQLTSPLSSSPSPERGSSASQNITGPVASQTPSVNGAILWFVGERNKTATSDGTVYSAPSNWTIAAQSAPNGNRASVVIGYWIQTTATAYATNLTFSGSKADGSNQSMQSTLVGFEPAIAVVPFPPMSLGGIGVQMCQ